MSKYKFGELLDYYCRRANITIDELAEKIGVSRDFIESWLQEETLPEETKVILILKLSKVLKLTEIEKNELLFIAGYVIVIGNIGGNFSGNIGGAKGIISNGERVTEKVESLRIDAAVPNEVQINQLFDLAVKIRQPSSLQLKEDDLSQMKSGEVQVLWPEDQPYIQLQIEVNAPDCEITGKNKENFRLYSGKDSPVYYFQLIPKKEGKIIIVIKVYQEDDWTGSARVHTIAQKQVGIIEIGIRSEKIALTYSFEQLINLSDEQIYILCYDYFPIVYKQLTKTHNKQQVIALLLNYARENNQFNKLDKLVSRIYSKNWVAKD